MRLCANFGVKRSSLRGPKPVANFGEKKDILTQIFFASVDEIDDFEAFVLWIQVSVSNESCSKASTHSIVSLYEVWWETEQIKGLNAPRKVDEIEDLRLKIEFPAITVFWTLCSQF